MCLAIPMRITAIDGALATIVAEGLEQRASLSLVPEAVVGDHVLVHAGYAITVLDAEEAEARIRLFAELEEFEAGERDNGPRG
jgi:hydrogenase expression/formation protein HypC